MGKKIASLTLCTFFMSFSISLTAQHLPVTVYNPRNGAMISGANSIFQDSKGWMWFTSGYEVIRYDGNVFKTYPVSSGVKMDFCYHVFEVNYEIWILADPYPLKVTGDSLYPLKLNDQNAKLIRADHINGWQYVMNSDGLYLLKNQQLQPFISDKNLSGIAANAQLLSFNDSMIVTYQFNQSIIAFDIRNRTSHWFSMPILDMKKDRKGNIFCLIDGQGIVSLKNFIQRENRLKIETEMRYAASGVSKSKFVIDHQDNIWMTNQNRNLQKITPAGKITIYSEKDGLPNTNFSQLLIDREENIWIALVNGLCKIGNINWDRYTKDEGLLSNHILNFSAAPGDGVFITTLNGLNYFNNHEMQQIKYNGEPVYCHHIIYNEGDYFYIRDSTLFRAKLDLTEARMIAKDKIGSFMGLGNRMVTDKKGTIFISTIHGLFASDKKRVWKIIPDSAYFRYLHVDDQNRLWIGEFLGGFYGYTIDYLNNIPLLRKFITLDSLPDGLPPLHAIRAISSNDRGDIIVGTRFNGVFYLVFQNNHLSSVKHFGEKDEIHSNHTWGTSVDSTGAFWISNSKGLFRISRQNYEWKITDEGTPRQIYQSSHVFTSKDNTVWVGNHPGVVFIKFHVLPATPFSVYITGLTMNGKPVDLSKLPQFTYKENNLNIEFSANTYLDENAVLYAYILKGAKNTQWSKPSSSHTLNFSSLSPGNYVLKIKGLNANGRWSENEASYTFSIMPPFWQRTWFIAVLALVIASGLYFLYRFRVKRLRELYEMRNMIARDLHDEIGSTLTSINILSKVSHRHLQENTHKAEELLQKVIDQSQQIQQNMSDIVWAIRPENDRMENMTFRMREYLSHTLEPKNIAIDFMVDEAIMQESLTMHQRRDFFLIFKEAVNNIAKYSQCQQAQIELSRKNDNIILIIMDNGTGFNVNRPGSSGLKNMQHRAQLLGGSLYIQSSPGAGTRIELMVPAT